MQEKVKKIASKIETSWQVDVPVDLALGFQAGIGIGYDLKLEFQKVKCKSFFILILKNSK